MPDMEKVIIGLNDIGGFIAGRVGFEQARNFLRTIDEAVVLLKEQEKPNGKCVNECECWDSAYERGKQDALKEQEAVEPTFRQDENGIFVWACGSCGAYMYHIYDGIDKANEYAKYCRQCGRKVKWE